MARVWSNEPTGRPRFEVRSDRVISCGEETLPKQVKEYRDNSDSENDHSQQNSIEDGEATHLIKTPQRELGGENYEDDFPDYQMTDQTTSRVVIGSSVVPPAAAPSSSDPLDESKNPMSITEPKALASSLDRDTVTTNSESNSGEEVNKRKRCYPVTMVLIILAVIIVSITGAVIFWKETRPHVCQPLPKVEHGEISCSDGSTVDSICTIKCLDNHQIQGNENLTCLNDASWSSDEPTCVCSNCYAGDKCQYPIKWNDIGNALDSIVPQLQKVVNYGGHAIACQGRTYKENKFHGKCRDTEEKVEYDCNKDQQGYDSVSDAAKHAASTLIKEMVNLGKYPKPCDPQDMETGC